MRSATNRLRRSLVCSLIERGWQAAREYSLDTQRSESDFLHVVKGRLDRSVRALVAPRPNIRLLSIPKRWFWPAAWSILAWGVLTGRLHAVLVDNDRSFRRLEAWMRAAGVSLIRAEHAALRQEPPQVH